MPIIKSAKKKLRQDKKRRLVNLKTISAYKKALSLCRKEPTLKNYQKASSLIDQAVKKNIIHSNKAARLKSRLSKKLGTVKTVVKKVKSQKSKVKTTS